MRVDEVMTRDVITVAPDVSLRDVARLLTQHRISGLPVCDDAGRVLGIVSEEDILRKEQENVNHGGGLLLMLFERDEEIAKATARTAGQAMTSPAVSIRPDLSVAAAARIMVSRKLKRLMVTEDSRLLGIVTRADLVRAFQRPDEDIRREVVEDVFHGILEVSPARVTVAVEDGIVSLRGEVDTLTQRDLADAYARRVPGVVDVECQLVCSE